MDAVFIYKKETKVEQSNPKQQEGTKLKLSFLKRKRNNSQSWSLKRPTNV